MFKRFAAKELEDLAKKYRIVTVLGPRQSGKTTLTQEIFPSMAYANLEALDTREFALKDPRAFLSKYPEGVILDEIQKVPELLSYIQVIVDEKKKKGMFILTGSHQLKLQEAISQSLAGRTALLELLPMSLAELLQAKIVLSLDEYIYHGGYPGIYHDNLNPTKAYRNYIQTYVERDLRQLIAVKDLLQFKKFIKILAGRIGQLLNMESIGNEVGISSHTVKEWLSILESSFIVLRLQPYFDNFNKRLVKTSKLYFTDVGLATYLLGIENITQLERDPLRGHLVENLVVLELIKARFNQGLDHQLYFYRDLHGNEIDLIFKKSNELIPIEIKASQTFNSEFLHRLYYFKKLAASRFKKGFLIYAGETEQKIDDFSILNFLNADKALE